MSEVTSSKTSLWQLNLSMTWASYALLEILSLSLLWNHVEAISSDYVYNVLTSAGSIKEVLLSPLESFFPRLLLGKFLLPKALEQRASQMH